MKTDFITSPDEKILWQGTPLYTPFIMPRVLELFDSLKFLAFATLSIIAISKAGGYHLEYEYLSLFAFVVISISIIRLGKRHLDGMGTTYYVTNHRVVIHNKNATITTKSLDRSWIKALDMTTSKTEQKYGVGTILIDTGEVRQNESQEEKVLYRLEAIPEPGSVLRMF